MGRGVQEMKLTGFKTKDEFDFNENYEDWYKGHRFGAMEDYLNSDQLIPRVKWILDGVEEGSTVLDLGCLDGFCLTTLANKKGITGEGVDLSKFGVGLARTRAAKHGFDLKFHNRAIEDLDLGKQFDYVLCCEVIEHVKDVDKLYEAIDKHLKPGGKVFMDTPDYDEPMGRTNPDPLHVRYYTHKLEHEADDAISLPKEIGEDRIIKVEVVDTLIQVEYGSKISSK
jgi:2-polyprenyl-3-methyl-5-hydroxy-6-metoxy-1,4-benzoquinol methylase